MAAVLFTSFYLEAHPYLVPQSASVCVCVCVCVCEFSGLLQRFSMTELFQHEQVAWAEWSSDGWFLNNSVVLNGDCFLYFGTGYSSDCGLVGHPVSGMITCSGNAVYSKQHAVCDTTYVHYKPLARSTWGSAAILRVPGSRPEWAMHRVQHAS